MNPPDWSQPVKVDLFSIYGFSTYFSWSQSAVGFGQLSLSVKPEGTVIKIGGDCENMGKEWVRKALHALVDTIADQLPDDRTLNVEIPIPEDILEHDRKLHRLLTNEEPDY